MGVIAPGFRRWGAGGTTTMLFYGSRCMQVRDYQQRYQRATWCLQKHRRICDQDYVHTRYTLGITVRTVDRRERRLLVL